jgi:RNA polymerase I-specific transcription initiation factor RRN7
MFSSMGVEETENESDTDDGTKKRQNRIKKLSALPTLVDQLALIYLAIYFLRIPIFVGDLIRWTNGNGLVFHSAVDDLPEDMKERVAGTVARMLNQKYLLTADKFQPEAWRLFMAYQRELSMVLPPLNVPPYLFRFIEQMALPIEVYPAVRRLGDLLSYTFEYSEEIAKSKRDPTPEMKLVVLVVIVVKLFYPFDGRVRQPTQDNEPAVAVVNWHLWSKTRKERDKINGKSNLSYDAASKVEEGDVFHMPEEKLDQYLDWFGKTWATPLESVEWKQKDPFAKDMFKLFPIGSNVGHAQTNDVDSSASAEERMEKVNAGLLVRTVMSPDKLRRAKNRRELPGNNYTRYRKIDDLEGIAKEFYTAAAEIAGLPLSSLLNGVMSAEIVLELWMQKRRKAGEQE